MTYEHSTDVPHSARVWSYWLGGTGHHPADRAAGDAFARIFPDVGALARASRGFLVRAVRHLAEAGVHQYLDLGAGVPVGGGENTHEVAQKVNSRARVVYVDHDPEVSLHRADFLSSTPEGTTDYLQADLSDPGHVLAHRARTLDLNQPVAVVLSDVIGHVHPLDRARATVTAYMDAVPCGSYLLLSHAVHTEREPRLQEYLNATGAAVPYHLRTHHEVASLFVGLEMVEPGLVPQPRWRPTSTTPLGPPTAGVAGLARKS